ncbi:kinase-like protein [Patellaria atrata CBS 101060]|uniref:non-specific serine/threonine protein kinase n=1 Tax=Patellaria atrata CBS 101060 TaxID=1346257 RepID=A0A9P4S7H1_9PEZI|nr:kinase-like protein [Patellaria atrata CBS 101060]
MADGTPTRSMSLVPYQPAESRAIVLRHGSAVVVYDEQSKQLSLRNDSSSGALERTNRCPYCHQSVPQGTDHALDDDYNNTRNDLHSDNYESTNDPDDLMERHSSQQESEATFINPDYFRMLHETSSISSASPSSSRPPSPHQYEDALTTNRSRSNARPPSSHNRHISPSPVSSSSYRTESVLTEDSTTAPVLARPPIFNRRRLFDRRTTPPSPHSISATAFSPGYFKRFFIDEGELGKGGKGVVLLVKHVLDGVSLGHFACKRVPVGDDHEWLEKVLQEVQLLQTLSHQNLVSYRHVWLEEFKPTRFGPSVPYAFILQQYCNSRDLHKYIMSGAQSKLTKEQMKEHMRRRSKGQLEPPIALKGPRRLPFDEIYSFFKDITSGINHLHANGFIHRDLKPSNCLLHRTGTKIRVLVSDFGEVQGAGALRKSTGATGTVSYCAPEVLKPSSSGGGLGNFTKKSDVFSLGMIVYFMCFARLPYDNADVLNEENEDLARLRDEITSWSGFDESQRERNDLPERLYLFLNRLLALAPASRPSTEEILRNIRSDSVSAAAGPIPSPPLLDKVNPRITRADTPPPPPPVLVLPRVSTTTSVHRALARPQVRIAARLALFGAKAWSLQRPCTPFAYNPTVGYPLLFLASLDLVRTRPVGLGRGSGNNFSLVLLVVHIVVWVFAGRWGVLCVLPIEGNTIGGEDPYLTLKRTHIVDVGSG